MCRHTVFNKILKLINKKIITEIVKKYESDKYSKSFTTWDQLVAMIFGQLIDIRSLSDLEIRYNFNENKKFCYQPNTRPKTKKLKRSTLSEANTKRKSEVFRDIAIKLINKAGKELKEIVSLIDSSIIRVDGRGSEWTKSTKTRCGKGLKLHIQCGVNKDNIENISITSTNINDVTEVKNFDIEKEKIYVFDKGYVDYNWWSAIDKVGAYFVTRIKTNTTYKTIGENDIGECSERIVSDKVVELTNKYPRGGKKNLLVWKALRLIEIYNEDSKKSYKFISNLMDARADKIATYYKLKVNKIFVRK